MAKRKPVTRWLYDLGELGQLEAGHHTIKVTKVSNNHSTRVITMKVELCKANSK